MARTGDMLVEVERFTLLVRGIDHVATLPPGSIPGYDAVGVVRQAAADGTGPEPGTRVVTLTTGGAWVQTRTVAAHEVATIPEEVDPGQATTLLVSGVSALRGAAPRRLGA
ncbi:hypothetical protein ABZ858_24105 [Streptomyces sp. NPDC047017]|uniref:hypothetical protein n=1 Tax=Streptomyces sp. NPDC047017 TaxID=3155024 RepID=UPI0034061DB7